jgi:transposase InsO family protein
MSRARLVITAVVVEGRSQAEVAREYGVSKGWVSKLVARYRTEGERAFEPHSRRPKRSPRRIGVQTAQRIVELRRSLCEAGLDAGPDTIAWHMAHHHNVTASPATVSRVLSRAGLIVPQPRKRPRSSYIRFEAAMPNETWQADFTHYRLTTTKGSPGPDAEILTWLDDCARFALSVTAHPRVTASIVLTAFRVSWTNHGIPASTLTDNGMVFTTRFAGGRGGRSSLEHELRRLNIRQKNSRPNHPTTCGKVERFQQTMKKWLQAQTQQPATIDDLQILLDQFVDEYNHRRPHRSLPGRVTPATIYQSRPKATPLADREDDTHDRVRHDIVDQAGSVTLRHSGRLHHIGIGRTHAQSRVILLVQDLRIRVVDATTGELLRDLILNPHRDYQPTGAPKGPTRTDRNGPNP